MQPALLQNLLLQNLKVAYLLPLANMPSINANDAPMSYQPYHVTAPLFEHQKRMLRAVINFEDNSSVCLDENQTFVSSVGFISCQPGSGNLLSILFYVMLSEACSVDWVGLWCQQGSLWWSLLLQRMSKINVK